jgi:hypothetical protein
VVRKEGTVEDLPSVADTAEERLLAVDTAEVATAEEPLSAREGTLAGVTEAAMAAVDTVAVDTVAKDPSEVAIREAVTAAELPSVVDIVRPVSAPFTEVEVTEEALPSDRVTAAVDPLKATAVDTEPPSPPLPSFSSEPIPAEA